MKLDTKMIYLIDVSGQPRDGIDQRDSKSS